MLTRLREYRDTPRKSRGFVGEFSRRSRLRLLKFMAGVDWSGVSDGLFVSLTYADACIPASVGQRNRQRYLFHRHMEEYLKVKVPMLWRVEYVNRKSGVNKGKFVPHFHLLLFGVKYIPAVRMEKWWRGVQGSEGWVSVKVDRLGDAEKAGLYVAKYAAKVPEHTVLGNRAYLNFGGRHYGYNRKALIPMHPCVRFFDIPPSRVEELRSIAAASLNCYDYRYDAGFNLLGPLARAWREKIMQLGIDAGVDVDYDFKNQGGGPLASCLAEFRSTGFCGRTGAAAISFYGEPF